MHSEISNTFMHFTLLNPIPSPLPRIVIILTVYCLGSPPSIFFLFNKQRLVLAHAYDDSRAEKQPVSNDLKLSPMYTQRK